MEFWNKRREPHLEFASLHEAVEAGNYAAVHGFLRNGIDANAQDGRDATALHIAAACGRVEIGKLLIEYGADVDFLIDEGGTPLMAACAFSQAGMVEFLISKGAQPNKKGEGGRSPLQCSFQPDVIAVDEQLECIDLLVKSGAIVNDRTDSGNTPLMTAAWFGNREAVEELLRCGADAKLRNNGGETAAMLAFERGHDELAKFLKQSAESTGER